MQSIMCYTSTTMLLWVQVSFYISKKSVDISHNSSDKESILKVPMHKMYKLLNALQLWQNMLRK